MDTTTRQILQLSARGMSTSEIADALDLSPSTVRSGIVGAIEELQVGSKLEAIIVAMRRGLIS